MNDHGGKNEDLQNDLVDTGETRELLQNLLSSAQLYKTSEDYKQLLDFIVRLGNFAPFNAMLLQLQKPGMRYAASAFDWRVKFGRYPKDDARPLVILWPFAPVALVYDVMDTRGSELPQDVQCFVSYGEVNEARITSFMSLLAQRKIHVQMQDFGDEVAGRIKVTDRGRDGVDPSYNMPINKNHGPAVQFATIVHELGHLFLGHLGPNPKLRIRDRNPVLPDKAEIEAESVAYIVCRRNGVTPKSQTYLSQFVDASTTADGLDIDRITRAAGQVSQLLELTGTLCAGAMPE